LWVGGLIIAAKLRLLPYAPMRESIKVRLESQFISMAHYQPWTADRLTADQQFQQHIPKINIFP
jgi:hypothetical protein